MKVTLSPSGRAFEVEADETIFVAAKRCGIVLPYGCSNGACGTCRAKILSGTVDHGRSQDSGLSMAARAEGWVLLCSAKPQTDLLIEAEALPILPGQTPKRVPGLVMSVDKLADDVMVVKLKLPATSAFEYVPGQYADLLLKDNRRRSFSIANAPVEGGHLEFHIRHIDGGEFTGWLFDNLKVRDVLRVEGPLGTFVLRPSSVPVILVAGGTGFAPVKAMIEHAIAKNETRPIHIYWGALNEGGLYMDELPRKWAETHANIRYIPMLSGEAKGWSGRRGLVHKGPLEDFSTMKNMHVYACGTPAMVDAVRAAYVRERDLPATSFFSDAFTFVPHAP